MNIITLSLLLKLLVNVQASIWQHMVMKMFPWLYMYNSVQLSALTFNANQRKMLSYLLLMTKLIMIGLRLQMLQAQNLTDSFCLSQK